MGERQGVSPTWIVANTSGYYFFRSSPWSLGGDSLVPRLASAWRSTYSIWPFKLRSSSSAQRSRALRTSASIRNKNAFRAMIHYFRAGSISDGSLPVDYASGSALSIVQRSSIEHRLRHDMAAQDHQQVADHGGPAFRVEIHDVFLGQHLQSMLDHADGPFDNTAAGGNDGPGLLALKHGGGDLRGVSQIADAGFQNLHSCRVHALVQLALEVGSHLFDVGAQGMLISFRGIVAVTAGQVA